MIKKLGVLTVILLPLFIFFSCQQKIDIENEKEAIKKVVENETNFFFARNFEEFSKTWVHAPYTFHTFLSNNFRSEDIGWDSLGTRVKSQMEITNTPLTDEIIRKNYSYRIYDNCAWVAYEEYFKSEMDENPDLLPSRQFRVLEKSDDGWKIAFLCEIDRNSYTVQNVEFDLNNAGYILLGQKKVKEAIEVFKTNVKLYPESSNVYDSLGEAYMKDGNKGLAIKNYEKSLEFDPENDNAKKMLEELKK